MTLKSDIMPDSPAVLFSILFFVVIVFTTFNINFEKMFLQRKYEFVQVEIQNEEDHHHCC